MYQFGAPVTMANASSALAEAARALKAGEREFSLALLDGSDSSVIALLLELQRLARTANTSLRLTEVPATVANFAALYDIDTLLPELGKMHKPAAAGAGPAHS